MNKIELLAPAGDLEKLKFAIIYGADAIYLGGEKLSLRAGSKNFSMDEIKEGIKFAHQRGKKIYIACNILVHNEDIEGAGEYFNKLEEIGADAFIISDPSFIKLAKKFAPNTEIHLSTQANMTNFLSADFWYEQGVKRMVPARELSLRELSEIKRKSNPNIEIEMFAHGAMCISYSGRCLMSNFMTGRDANKGDCAQPCRWNYSLVEEKRPGEYFPVVEDERGTYFFNSKDLCLIREINQIIEANIDSIKIEGRMKTLYYVASIVRCYRKAIDDYYKNPDSYEFDENLMDELLKVSHRDFTTGFFYGKDNMTDSQNYSSSSYIRNYDFTGVVIYYDKEKKLSKVEQRNKFIVGEKVEIIGPNKDTIYCEIKAILDENGNMLDESNVPMQKVYVDFGIETSEFDIIRSEKKK